MAHDLYDWFKDIVLPAAIGVGTLSIAFVAFIASRRTERERRFREIENELREAWLARRKFGHRLERLIQEEAVKRTKPTDAEASITRADREYILAQAVECPEPTSEMFAKWVMRTWDDAQSVAQARDALDDTWAAVGIWIDSGEEGMEYVARVASLRWVTPDAEPPTETQNR